MEQALHAVMILMQSLDQYHKSIFDETVNYPGIDNMRGERSGWSHLMMAPWFRCPFVYNKNTVLNGKNSCTLPAMVVMHILIRRIFLS